MTRTFARIGWPFRRSLLFDSTRAEIVWRTVRQSDTGRRHPDQETLYRTASRRWFVVTEEQGRQRAVWLWRFEARWWLLRQTGPTFVLLERWFPGSVEPA